MWNNLNIFNLQCTIASGTIEFLINLIWISAGRSNIEIAGDLNTCYAQTRGIQWAIIKYF